MKCFSCKRAWCVAAISVLPVMMVLLIAMMPHLSQAQPRQTTLPLAGRHVAFLVGQGVHDAETYMPLGYLVNRGARVTVIGVEVGEVTAYNSDFQVYVHASVDTVAPESFDALVIPGGRSPAFLREHETVVRFVRAFAATGKPIAAICHGPQVLVTADVLQGVQATCVSSISEELTQAGARYVDESVVRDRQFITSRVPRDLPAFSHAIAQSLVPAPVDAP